MYDDIMGYVAGCKECQQNKTQNALPPGVLPLFEVPERCWDVVTAAFLAELLTASAGYDAILVIVEK